MVQFSHCSAKEFLTSRRLGTSSIDVARYHIVPEPAHLIMAQACTSILLQSEGRVEEDGVWRSSQRSPLARYAARHWVTHVQFENVSLFLRKAMEYLFDLDKPYFATWLQLHDLDAPPNEGVEGSSSLYFFAVSKKSGIIPLYYAALCGFQDLVEHLIVKYPHHQTLLEPVPPPSPYWVCSEGQDFTSPSSFLTLATTSLGSHRHLLHRRLAGKRRSSRCLMCTGTSSSEKQAAFELDWGLFASSLTRPFLCPICSLWRPVQGPPLVGTPAYPIPPPQGSHQPPLSNHLSYPYPTPGLWPAVGHRRHPPLQYPGLFQAPPPSLHPGTGDSSPPKPTLAYIG
jgi:hypothetical protein